MTLTAERLRQVLRYDPNSGTFIRIGPSRKRGTKPEFIGTVAGHLMQTGRVAVRVDGKAYLAHRLAWLYMIGVFPDRAIDHRDNNPANNRWSNLRECSMSQNIANSVAVKNTVSGCKGVTYCRQTGKWRAKIKRNGKNFHMGRFDSINEARAAYAAKARELYGEFARFQ